MLFRSLASAVAVAVVMAGKVASRSQLDTATIERQVAESLSTSSGRTTTVICPDEVALAESAVFACTASEAGGTSSTIEVTQEDGDGSVTWRLAG